MKKTQARNALKHGLAAKKEFPEAIRLETVGLRRRLRAELAPASAFEEILVGELARHGAAMKFASVAEPAVLRSGAACGTALNRAIQTNVPQLSDLDELLAAAVTSDGLEKFSRYRRQHERAFHDAWSLLERVRSQGKASRSDELMSRFADESACCDYLTSRLKSQPCTQCGGKAGSWLRMRRRWECGRCRFQAGIRTGTVMEHSRLRLTVWFQAIIALSSRPDFPAAQLAVDLGISRISTVRAIAKKVRTTAGGPEADRLLAGLPGLLLSRTPP